MADEPKIFIDANIFLDVLRQRKDWQASYEVLEKVRLNKVVGLVLELTIAIIWFQLARNIPKDTVRERLRKTFLGFNIVTPTPKQVEAAMEDEDFDDVEDAMQFHIAKDVTKIILTRNKSDFAKVSK